MRKIKVVFCMYQMITGGIEIGLIRILEKMCKLPEYEFFVIVKQPVTNKLFLNFFIKHKIPLITVYYYPSILGEPPTKFFAKILWQVKKVYFRFKYKDYKKYLKMADIIIDFFNCSFFSEIKYIKKPKIGWYHSGFEVYSKSFETFNQQFLTNYNKFVVLTDDFLYKLLKITTENSDKIIKIYNLIDINQILKLSKSALMPDKNIKYFTFVARMHEDKDHITVINAFSKFSKNYPEAKIYFIGDGDKRLEYEKIVHKQGLSSKIIFTGNLDNPLGYINNAVANILSSPSEGLPYVLIEAAVLRTLNIASNCPSGPGEILLNGKSGLLFNTGNSDQLSNLMSAVWENRINVEELIEVGFNSLNRFNPELIIAQIDNLIKKEIGYICK